MNEERASWTPFVLVYAGLALLFGWYATIEFLRFPVTPEVAAALYVCLLLLLGLYLAPASQAARAWLSSRAYGVRGYLFCLISFLLPYLVYSLGTQDFEPRSLAKLSALAAFPFAVFAFGPVREPSKLNIQDVAVLLWLMIPVLAGWIGGIWTKPVNLDFMTRFFLVGVGSWSFLVWRGVEGAGYELRWSLAVLGDASTNFLAYSLLAIPLGFGLRFITWNPHWRGLQAFFLDYLTIFLFIAVTEELLFRGLLQNLLEGTLSSRYWAQAIASAVFGLTHILHAPFPNWRYVALATLAGWFYGSAYRAHRSLLASALVHALVDTAWRTFFTV